MSIRYDLISPRPRSDDKTYWHKVGAAFEAKNGGFNLVFDSLPLPDKEGRLSVLMREAKDLREASGTGQRQQSAPHGGAAATNDDIPFSQEAR